MTWLWVAILAYFFFALASMGDRYLLIGPPNPKIYAFYVGILGIISVVLIPFVGFYIIPGYLVLLVGLVFFLSILTLYESLERFEVSRIIPALGGFLPIFTLLLAFLIIGSQEFLGFEKVLSFILLISGSILISIERSIKLSLKSIAFAALAAFFLSLYFVLSKVLFSENSFWTSFIWIRIWTFIFTLFLLFFKGVRKEIFAKKKAFSKKTGSIFLINQIIGALAVVLQNWSIALAEAAFISFVSALQGVQYAFLFLFTSLFPNILKEKRTKKIVVQKIVAIILIGAGLGILAF
jgi:hypothetical protein